MSSISFTSDLVLALEQNYEELVRHLRRGPLARWHAEGMAREVVHDVCAELLQTPQARAPRSPLAFLRVVCSRRAIDRWRQEQRHAQCIVYGEHGPEALAAPWSEPERVLDGRQRLALLSECVQALPPRCRDVFVMVRIHGVAQAQVAEHLGISLKTVEKHLRLGTQACRDRMGELLQVMDGR